MAPLNILISGAGIAGTALAFFLSKLGHTVTVIERAAELRTNGLQLDLRGPGLQVIRRTGLEEYLLKYTVAEQGLALVDSKGKQWGFFPANKSGKGLQSFTTDFEIMRGDLVRGLVEACGDRVKFVFGVYVVSLKEKEGWDGVNVGFSNGTSGQYDLVVGADGVGSKIRRIMLGCDASRDDSRTGYYPLGVFAAYCTIQNPLQPNEEYNATSFISTGNRGIMTRRHDPKVLQVYAMCRTRASKRLEDSTRGDFEEEMRAMTEVFRGAGWECDRMIKAMAESEDLYCDRMAVVTLDAWSRGRIVLVGDAGYCPSAMTGMGTSCAMIGAYILAGEIVRHCGPPSSASPTSSENIAAALKTYEQKLRPFMDQVQKGLTDTDDYMANWPSSSFGVACVYFFFWISSILRLDLLARLVLRENVRNWELPQYNELDKS
ncbi:uncharacterized protein BDV14DRAFT_207378 [Aspergillus stella-maris]|uniref:uncharacterized protein n=1 Tax=Aspergillus stella-maris TaxID=1810926 RepID=UPI003CCCA266